MQDQGTGLFSPEAASDGEIMATLLVSTGQWPWTVEEIIREVGSEVEAIDSLNRLHGGGLIHRLDGFVFPTRAAVCSHYLAR